MGSYSTVSPSPVLHAPSKLRRFRPARPQRDSATCRRQSPGAQDLGRLLSVPLSIASRRPAVSRHPALWSPDFPLHGRKHHAATAQPASRAHPILVGESPGAVIFWWSPNFWLRRNLKVSLRRNLLRRLSLHGRKHHAATAQPASRGASYASRWSLHSRKHHASDSRARQVVAAARTLSALNANRHLLLDCLANPAFSRTLRRKMQP